MKQINLFNVDQQSTPLADGSTEDGTVPASDGESREISKSSFYNKIEIDDQNEKMK